MFVFHSSKGGTEPDLEWLQRGGVPPEGLELGMTELITVVVLQKCRSHGLDFSSFLQVLAVLPIPKELFVH